MTTRSIRRVLLSLIVLGIAMDVVSLAVNVHIQNTHQELPIYEYLVESLIGGLALTALSLLMALRRPDHPVTWALIAAGTFDAIQTLLGSYAVEALIASPGELPGGRWALAVSLIAQLSFVLCLMLMVNIFPTGRPLTPRWGLLLWILPAVFLTAVFDILTIDMEVAPGVTPVPAAFETDQKALIGALTITTTFLFIVGTVGHVVTRYVRSRGVERQQLKWFVFTFILGVALLMGPWIEDDTIGAVLWTAVPVAVFSSMAIAILRYRLYEIDRIVSRTVSYGLVIALLGVVVLGVVSVFALFLPSDDPLVVAASTLSVAALFNPLRRGVQTTVDRRFNRSRYDAERVVESFVATLQEEVDPQEVVDGWVRVVSDTMQPAAVGVWVRTR